MNRTLLRAGLTTLVVAASFLGARADIDTVRVVCTDNSTTDFTLTFGMGANYEGTNPINMVLFRYGGTYENQEELMKVPLADVTDFLFFDSTASPGGVNGVASDHIRVDLTRGVVGFTGVTSPLELSVASVSGALEFSSQIYGDGSIDIKRFGAGIHIVKLGKTTFKILVK